MYDGMDSPGRNDPCWCGSGKKYKKCHWAEDEHLAELDGKGLEVPPRSLLKSEADIEGIQKSAEVNIGLLDYVGEHIKAGVSTAEIDKWVYDYTVAHDAIPADLNYEGYPKSVCTSINNVICHGIPNDKTILKDGDIINVDASTIKDGYFSDSSRMLCIGNVPENAKRLVDVCHQAIQVGLDQVKPWGRLGDVGAAINKFAKKNGYSVVAEYGGHGIGKEFHEDPFVSFVSRKNTGMVLAPGLVFTIEPMINEGKPDIDDSDPDGWGVRTVDGKLSAQWEVQLEVTDNGYKLLSW